MPSTPTEALLDVNVLIAAVFVDHVQHAVARRAIGGLSHFFTTPTVQGGFLRFATRPLPGAAGTVPQPRLTIAEAHATLCRLTRSTRHLFLPDDAPFADLSPHTLMGHRQWTDAYLLLLARRHNLVLATLDQRMVSLDDPVKSLLWVLA